MFRFMLQKWRKCFVQTRTVFKTNSIQPLQGSKNDQQDSKNVLQGGRNAQQGDLKGQQVGQNVMQASNAVKEESKTVHNDTEKLTKRFIMHLN